MRAVRCIGLLQSALLIFLFPAYPAEPDPVIFWHPDKSLKDAPLSPSLEMTRRRASVIHDGGRTNTFDVVYDETSKAVWVGTPAHTYVSDGERIYGLTFSVASMDVTESQFFLSSPKNHLVDTATALRTSLLHWPEFAHKKDRIIDLGAVFGAEFFAERVNLSHRMIAAPFSVRVLPSGFEIEFRTVSGAWLMLRLDATWTPRAAFVDAAKIVMIDDGRHEKAVEEWGVKWSEPAKLVASCESGTASLLRRTSENLEMLFEPSTATLYFGPNRPGTIYWKSSGAIYAAQLDQINAVLRIYRSADRVMAHEELIPTLKQRSRQAIRTTIQKPIQPKYSIDIARLLEGSRFKKESSMAAFLQPESVRVASNGFTTIRIRLGRPAAGLDIQLNDAGEPIRALYKRVRYSYEGDAFDLSQFEDAETVPFPPLSLDR